MQLLLFWSGFKDSWALTSPVGNRVFSDRSDLGIDRMRLPAYILYDKPCRNDVLYGNVIFRVSRTCLSATCAFPPSMTGNPSISSAMR